MTNHIAGEGSRYDAVNATPIAWVIPGDDNAKDNGFIDAMAWRDGEFTRPLYASPPSDSVAFGKAVALIQWGSLDLNNGARLAWKKEAEKFLRALSPDQGTVAVASADRLKGLNDYHDHHPLSSTHQQAARE